MSIPPHHRPNFLVHRGWCFRLGLGLGLIFAPLIALQAQEDRISARYEELLLANPSEGIPLDRLWKRYEEQSSTAALLERWKTLAAEGDPTRAFIYALLLKRSGAEPEALAALEQLLKNSPNHLGALAQIADLSERRQEWAKASQFLQKALDLTKETDPQRGDLALRLGSLLLRQQKKAEAQAAFEIALAARPSDLELRERLARLYDANDAFDQAEAQWKVIANEAEPAKKTEAWRQLSRFALDRGDFAGAVAALEAGIDLTSRENWLRKELQSQLIHLYQRESRLPELEAKWNAAVEKNPRDLGALLRMLDLYQELADPHRLKVWLEKVILLAPRLREYRFQLAKLCGDLGDFDQAADLLDALLTEHPEKPEYVLARAGIDVQKSDPPSAAARLEKLLAARPGDEPIAALVLDFFLRNRMDEAAERLLQHSAESGNEENLLALANFHLTRRRSEAALSVLERLDSPGLPSADRINRRLRIANLLREQELFSEALSSLDTALTLAPGNIDVRLARSEIYTQLGEFDKAVEEARFAYQSATTDELRDRADERLFQIFHLLGEQSRPTENANAERDTQNFTITTWIEGLRALAEQTNQPEAWIRVAKWTSWTRNTPEALKAAARAVEKNPDSIAAREFYAKLAAESGRDSVAIEVLEGLIRSNPKKEVTYQRQIGQILLVGLRFDEAITTFTKIVEANPGATDALADLAGAYERAERWDPALETWQKALRIPGATDSAKIDLLRPVVRLHDRLGMHAEALQLLLTEFDAVSDEAQKLTLFQMLVDYASRQNLLPTVEKDLRARLRRDPDNHGLLLALAALERSRGNQQEAFQLLMRAQRSASSPSNSLESLVRAAEELGDLEAAIRFQRRLIMSEEKPDAENLKRLAKFEEQRFDYDEAARTWHQIVSRFPRDPSVLEAAGEFYQQADRLERAAEILRKVLVLDPTNTRLARDVAKLDEQLGADREAAEILERVIALEPPEAKNRRLQMVEIDGGEAMEELRRKQPRPPRSAQIIRSGNGANAKVFLANPPFTAEAGDPIPETISLRLEAIRDLATLYAKPAFAKERADWIARWSAPEVSDTTEALWAFFYAKAAPECLALLERATADTASLQEVRLLYPWIAIQFGEFERLSAWLRGLRGDLSLLCSTVLSSVNALSGIPMTEEKRSRAVAALFPEDFPSVGTLRDAARLLAEQGSLPQAIELGRRVFQNAAFFRPLFALEIAGWLDAAGDPAEAAKMLAIAAEGPLDFFDSPALEGALQSYRHLPADERKAWLVRQIQLLEKRRNEPLAPYLKAVFLGLNGQTEEAKSELLRFYRARMQNSGMAYSGYDSSNGEGSRTRHVWHAISAAGTLLDQWGLPDLCATLWQAAVEDEAFAQLDGDEVEGLRRDLRNRLWAFRIAAASQVGLGEALTYDFLGEVLMSQRTHRLPKGKDSPQGAAETAIQVASFLSERGFAAESALILQELQASDASNTDVWKALVSELRRSGRERIAEDEIRKRLQTSRASKSGAPWEVIAELSDTIRLQNRAGALEAMLLDVSSSDPGDLETAMLLAEELRSQKRTAEAMELYREILQRNPGKTDATVAAIEALFELGETAAAVALIDEALAADPALKQNIAPKAVVWLARSGKTDRALLLARRLLAAGQDRFLPELAIELVRAGQRSKALSVMRVFQEKTGNNGFNETRRFFREAFGAGQEPELGELELRRLSRTAKGDPMMEREVLEERVLYAQTLKQLPQLQEQLRSEWNEGNGNAHVGASLLRVTVLLEQPTEADRVVRQIIEKPGVDSALLLRLSEFCREKGQPGIEALLLRKLISVTPRTPLYRRRLAEVLWALGKKEEAMRMAHEIHADAALQPEELRLAAALFRQFGQPKLALAIVEEALAFSKLRREIDLSNDRVSLLLEIGDLPAAKSALNKAFRNPGNRNAPIVFQYLRKAGLLQQTAEELRKLDISSTTAIDVWELVLGEALERGDLDAALKIAASQPELLVSRENLIETFSTAMLQGGRFAESAPLFESALAKVGASNSPQILTEPLYRASRSALVKLLTAWAETEITADHESEAIKLLERAQQHAPKNAEIGKRLSVLRKKAP